MHCATGIVPVDGFFEWRAIRSARGKQPYALWKMALPSVWPGCGSR